MLTVPRRLAAKRPGLVECLPRDEISVAMPVSDVDRSAAFARRAAELRATSPLGRSPNSRNHLGIPTRCFDLQRNSAAIAALFDIRILPVLCLKTSTPVTCLRMRSRRRLRRPPTQRDNRESNALHVEWPSFYRDLP